MAGAVPTFGWPGAATNSASRRTFPGQRSTRSSAEASRRSIKHFKPAFTEALAAATAAYPEAKVEVSEAGITLRQTKLNYNLAWAKTYLKKVGALENSSRGVWSITKVGEGFSLEDALAVPARVRKQALEDKRAKDLAHPMAAPGENPATAVETEELEATEAHWKTQLLSILHFARTTVGDGNCSVP